MAPCHTNVEAETAYPCGGVLEVEGFEIEGTYDSQRLLLLTRVSFSGINKVGPVQNRRVTRGAAKQGEFCLSLFTQKHCAYIPPAKSQQPLRGATLPTPQGPVTTTTSLQALNDQDQPGKCMFRFSEAV